jgi:tetratricopeptide (TPR) repeat protein
LELSCRLIDRRPNSDLLYQRRAAAHARTGLWKEAAEDYSHAVNLAPRVFEHRFCLAAVYLQLGDLEACRALCSSSLEAFKNPDVLLQRDFALVCCLIPGPQHDIDTLVHFAESAASEMNNADAKVVPWLVAYRQGKWAESLQGLRDDRGLSVVYKSSAKLFLAMAYERLGDTAQATEHLNMAERYIGEYVPTYDGPPLDFFETCVVWCMVNAVRREAAELICGRVQAD